MPWFLWSKWTYYSYLWTTCLCTMDIPTSWRGLESAVDSCPASSSSVWRWSLLLQKTWIEEFWSIIWMTTPSATKSMALPRWSSMTSLRCTQSILMGCTHMCTHSCIRLVLWMALTLWWNTPAIKLEPRMHKLNRDAYWLLLQGSDVETIVFFFFLILQMYMECDICTSYSNGSFWWSNHLYCSKYITPINDALSMIIVQFSINLSTDAWVLWQDTECHHFSYPPNSSLIGWLEYYDHFKVNFELLIKSNVWNGGKPNWCLFICFHGINVNSIHGMFTSCM